MKKTNAMRILEKNRIPYETDSYTDDGEHTLERGAALMMAEKLNIDPAAVFKTIVMRTETKELCVFCQSALYEINLKKARTAADVKDVEPVKPAELLSLTGYVRGGCSPIGMKKQYRTFIDQQALQLEKIYISAGVRGQQIVITPQNLIKATGAQVCDLVLE
ncbi:MAG: Cys-tRNA(Pro) deacylase [Treponema sp.]|jgi:Cys-tRNA(Pro)/Cys-tRNA(Cys) deacylase|nr:Cys-tRNA(Pro) deacylase [Treponema sp.]